MTTFGSLLRQLRTDRSLTQHSLGVEAGLSPNTIARIERDEQAPDWQTVQKIASALGVGVEIFAQTNGEKK